MEDSMPIELGDTIEAPQGSLDPEPTLLHADRNDAVRSAIARLSDRERHILALVHVQEVPGAEIGRMLGVSESRVSQILAGIRRKLKDQLDLDEAA
jgi:RNA polymerase sigma factor (sigma-70 family)